MFYSYDKDKIKNSLTIEQIEQLLEEFGGDPYIQNGILISKTICHNSKEDLGEASHKLYYYDNTHLFHCFTDCSESFDIFELVKKIKELEYESEYPLPACVEFIAQYFNFSNDSFLLTENNEFSKKDWQLLERYDKIKEIEIKTQIVKLKTYDDSFLKNLSHPKIDIWTKEGISQEIMDYYEICYDPKNCGIVIPHRDIQGNLIGVRERILSLEISEQYGKYLPMKVNGTMYNHPLSFSLYGIYQNQENIKNLKKALIVESEKAVLQYGTMFGQDNNIACAICGSAFIQYQAWLLIQLGVEEIIIGLDKQYQELNDKEHKKLVKNLKQIYNKYGHYVKVSFLFDKGHLLDYKDAPTDKGKNTFMELYKNKINLY